MKIKPITHTCMPMHNYRERAYENERFYGCFALLLLTEIRKIQISVRIQISAAA